MTDKPEEREYVNTPRMFTEKGSASRAVVINYTLAWAIFVVAIGALITGVVWVTTIDNRVSTLETLQIQRDAQTAAFEMRVRPLEITAASIALLASQIDTRFADLNRRLDRAEDEGRP